MGGVWNYTKNIAGRTPVPNTSPHCPPEAPIWPDGAATPLYSNPMYDVLNTNIPKHLMQYSDQDFEAESLLFPTREDVQAYLVKYSRSLRGLIRFSTQVEDVRRCGDHWELLSRSTVTGEKKTEQYDAIVVASGHYSVPYIPSVLGIEEFNATFPSVITHSKVYRAPAAFEGKKVIVVGGAASGLDIGTQISQVCEHPLLNSVRTPAPVKMEQEKKEEVPAIAEYLVDIRGVRFTDGRVEKDIDAIVYCTGYMYSYPFLETLKPAVVTNGSRVIGIYRDIFNFTHPTLAFAALGKKSFPFPTSESQGAAIAKVWTNQLTLPSKREMEEAEQKLIEERGDGVNYHVLGYPKDVEYIIGLHDWVKTANDPNGKQPPSWGHMEMSMRERYVEIRKKFVETGGIAKTTEELGFDFSKPIDS